MKAALTGATGFVGSHLLDALVAREARVRCLVRPPAAATRLAAAGHYVVLGGLADAPALARLCEGADVVFHVAGAIAAVSEAAFLAVNRDGTAAVAEAARAAGVSRLVYVSSLAVTGPTARGRRADESGPPAPVTAYGRSKGAGEDALRRAGVDFTIVRPPIVYGPRDRQVLRLFRLARRGFVPLLGDGAQELSLVHARDLARALIEVAEEPRCAGRTYHSAQEEVVTQRALMARIAGAVGVRARFVPLPVLVVRAALHMAGVVSRVRGTASLIDPAKANELLAPAWTCASEAIARDTGWRADTLLDEGLRATAAAYRAAGWL